MSLLLVLVDESFIRVVSGVVACCVARMLVLCCCVLVLFARLLVCSCARVRVRVRVLDFLYHLFVDPCTGQVPARPKSRGLFENDTVGFFLFQVRMLC